MAKTPFVKNDLRLGQTPVDPPTIGGKRDTPPMSGQQVRAAGNIQAQFGASLGVKPPPRRR